ncbi:hypothetical protein, partial [Stenotrophomonas sp. MY18]|uniref:hypothetical protein n=1 Tax=Stenotrophomonas sp. MY18 TaxID=2662207 RepID=UPI001C12A224
KRNIGQAQSQAGGFRFHIAVGKSPLPLRPVGNFFTLLIQLPGVKATVAKLVSDTGMDDQIRWRLRETVAAKML